MTVEFESGIAKSFGPTQFRRGVIWKSGKQTGAAACVFALLAFTPLQGGAPMAPALMIAGHKRTLMMNSIPTSHHERPGRTGGKNSNTGVEAAYSTPPPPVSIMSAMMEVEWRIAWAL